MSVQDDIIYYYRRAAEARARGHEALAQSMENYARNLEAGIYNDDGRGFDIGVSNKRWADKEAAQRKQMASRRQGEENLYQKARPTMAPSTPPKYPSVRREYAPAREVQPSYSGYGPGYTEPLEYEAPKVGPGYTEPPMDYAAPAIGRRSPERESAENGLYELFSQSNGGFAEWPSKFPSKAASTNSVADFRRRDEAAGYAPKQSGIPEFELPPMVITADAPRAQKPVPKLKGQAPRGGYQPQQSGHTGVVKFFDDGADVEAWKRAHPKPETPRNKYGATRGSFLDFLQTNGEEGIKRWDW